MKNLIFFFVLLSFAAKGQDNETTNKFILGGSISGSYFNTQQPEQEIMPPGSTSTFTTVQSSNNNYNFRLSPYLGFQLNNRSLIGIQTAVGFSGFTSKFNNDDDNTTKSRSSLFGTGLFYRFYLNPKNKFKLFIQPSTNVSVENATREDFAPALEEQRTIVFDAGIGLGATYRIAEKWNLLVNIWNVRYNYNNFRSGGEDESTIRTFVSAGLSLRSISFGAEYLF